MDNLMCMCVFPLFSEAMLSQTVLSKVHYLGASPVMNLELGSFSGLICAHDCHINCHLIATLKVLNSLLLNFFILIINPENKNFVNLTIQSNIHSF